MEAGDRLTLNMNDMENYLLSHSLIHQNLRHMASKWTS